MVKETFYYIMNRLTLESLGLKGGLLDVFFSLSKKSCGSDTSFFTRDFLYPKVASYFEILFPDFSEEIILLKIQIFISFRLKILPLSFWRLCIKWMTGLELLKIADEQK